PLDDLRARISLDLRAAMKARDTIAISTLRALLGALDNATAVEVEQRPASLPGGPTEVPRRTLTRAELVELLDRQAVERWKAAMEYERIGLTSEMSRSGMEATIVEGYVQALREPDRDP